MDDKDWARKQIREAVKFYQQGKLSRNQLTAIIVEAFILESQHKLSSKVKSIESKLRKNKLS